MSRLRLGLTAKAKNILHPIETPRVSLSYLLRSSITVCSNPVLISTSLLKHEILPARQFSSTRYYCDGIIRDTSLSPQEIHKEALYRYDEFLKEWKYFEGMSPDGFTPDIITEVSKLFNWLYANEELEIGYKLLCNVKPHYRAFFKFNQYSKMIDIFDKFGTSDDLFLFCETFRYEKVPNVWKKLDRLASDATIRQLIELSNAIAFEDAKSILDNLFFDKGLKEGQKFFTLRICSALYRRFDSNSKMELYRYLNQSTHMMQYFPPSLISQLFVTYSSEIDNRFDLQFAFLEKFIRPHFDKSNIDTDSFKYKLISSIPKDYPTLKFKLWYEFCYYGEELRYDNEIPSILYLKNNKIHYVPRKFEAVLNYEERKLSRVLSVLIYTHSKYESIPKLASVFFLLKIKLSLNITRSDKIGYLRSLNTLKQDSKAKTFLNQCLAEDPTFESEETLNPILLILARNKEWSELESLYFKCFAHNEAVTKEQYTILLTALSLRAGTNKIVMELWENFLKRGFSPNDQVLCAIIQCFLRNKSYNEALQWFTAYSHYKVELSPRSYGLMLQALTSIGDVHSMLLVLDELTNKNARLHKFFFPLIFEKLSEIGDYKTVSLILTDYYPKFNLAVDREDTRWIMKCHYHAQRYNLIVDSYLMMQENEILYKDSLLALEAAIKFSDVKMFEKIWSRAYNIHSQRGDLDIKAYISYMAYWVRKNGSFGIVLKLNEIKQKLKIEILPAIVFNQMIFSAFRTHRPWLTKKIVGISLRFDVTPSPKMYSLILQSNVSMPWVARNSIDETIVILEEFLTNRRVDKFGKLNDDINPMSFKLIIKAILEYKSVVEARRLFEMYVELARDNLLDNVHILNIELLLLGKEERWVDFNNCYERFSKIIMKYSERARFKDERLASKFNESSEFNRLDVFNDSYLQIQYDESKFSKTDAQVKIPNWIKKSHYDIWIYRLKQLEFLGRLNEVNEIVEDLMSKGIIFSNKNLNETALFLSEHPELLEETATFLDTYLLPHHIRNKHMKHMSLRYGTDQIPGIITKPVYRLNNDAYPAIMKNISISLDTQLTPEQKELFLSSITESPKKYLMKNLGQMMKERRHMRSSYLRMRKLRKIFHRDLRNKLKVRTLRTKRHMSMRRVERQIGYETRMLQCRTALSEITKQLHTLTDLEDLPRSSLCSKSSEKHELLEKKKSLKMEMEKLNKEREEAFKEMKRKEREARRKKTHFVGSIDLNRL